MKSRYRKPFGIIAFISALLLWSVPSWTDPVSSLVDGPVEAKAKIGNASHLQLKARKPAHARLLWVNFSALKDMGIDLPEDGLNPAFEKELGDAVHWVIPDDQAKPGDFAAGERIVEPSIYGGSGIGTNVGDGRAASLRKIQIKYIGKTGLSAVNSDFTHGYGRGPLSRGFSEALWGEVAQDFPWGANRTLTVSDRGTDTVWPDQQKEREGLVSREDPVRPAHFTEKFGQFEDGQFPPDLLAVFKAMNEGRFPEAMKALPNALPHPAWLAPDASVATQLREGLLEYSNRLAEQKSFEVANRVFHAATSTSNIEISGKLLDYDTMTAQPHYAQLVTGLGEKWGDPTEPLSYQLQMLHFSLDRRLPKELAKELPSPIDLKNHFLAQYRLRRKRNFVELTGLPRTLVAELQAGAQGKEAIGNLGGLLDKIAFEGSEPFVFKDAMPEPKNLYDLPRILVELASHDPFDSAGMAKSLEHFLPEGFRSRLVEDYSALMRMAYAKAASEGIDVQRLRRYVYENSKLRNADIPDMHRPELRKENERLVDEYLRTGNRSAVWDSIDTRAQRSRRVYRSDDPFVLILNERSDPLHGAVARHVYDARTGQFEVVLRTELKDGQARFFGNRIPVGELSRSRLLTSMDGWKAALAPTIGETHAEFRIPATADHPGSIELALRSEDGHKWWKAAGDRNVRISFVKKHSIPAHPGSPSPDQLPALQSAKVPPDFAPSLSAPEVEAPIASRPKKRSRLSCMLLSLRRAIHP